MSTPSTKASAKTAKSRIVVLQLPPDSLRPFLSSPSSPESSSAAASEDKQGATPSIQQPTPSPADRASDSNDATPAAQQEQDQGSLAPPKPKRKGGWPAGRKRAPPSIDPNGPLPKERGRPGPKKKPRLPDGTIDRTNDSTVPVKVTGNPIPAHKLGPKANTGAINAGLRALDRSGKPCRKWERKGLQLKSFTGTAWDMSSWRAPPRNDSDRAETKSDSTNSSELAAKPNESSAVPSEDRSHAGADANGDHTMGSMLESSPPPVPA